jgi:hypothetical protein
MPSLSNPLKILSNLSTDPHLLSNHPINKSNSTNKHLFYQTQSPLNLFHPKPKIISQ